MWFENRRRALPKFRSCVLTLAELELAACTGLTGLLTLNLTRVTRHEAVLLEYRAHLRIDFAEGAGDTKAGSLSLAFDSATVESDGDVEIFSGRSDQQRLFHHILENFQRKVGVQGFLLDSNVPFAGFHVNASYSSFSTSNAVYNFHTHYLISFKLIVLGA